jgi:hypothetical protein
MTDTQNRDARYKAAKMTGARDQLSAAEWTKCPVMREQVRSGNRAKLESRRKLQA